MEPILQLYLVWIIVGIVLMVDYTYLGTSLVFWVAGGLTFVALSPIQLPDLSKEIGDQVEVVDTVGRALEVRKSDPDSASSPDS